MMILPAQIIQAPMAGAQGADLAIAVCRVGGIGSLPAAMLSADILSQELEKIIQSVGDSPYSVNFFAHKTPSVSEQERAKWLTLLLLICKNMAYLLSRFLLHLAVSLLMKRC